MTTFVFAMAAAIVAVWLILAALLVLRRQWTKPRDWVVQCWYCADGVHRHRNGEPCMDCDCTLIGDSDD